MMRVRCRLADLLQERGASVARFAREAGVSYPRANALARNLARAITWDVLEAVCRWAGCGPERVLTLERVPKGTAREAFDLEVTEEGRRLAERARRAERVTPYRPQRAKSRTR